MDTASCVESDSLKSAMSYLPEEDARDVLHALERAQALHAGQMRSSGEPFVNHPIAVAHYLALLEAEKETLIAALLHDVVEDGHATYEEILDEFGAVVAHLVDGVTKLSKLQYEGRRSELQVASLRKLLLAANDDLRVIFIKLADRWHNIETLHALGPDKQERIAKETLDIYVPFARLVGLWELKERFEHVCFPIAYPEEYATWSAAVTEKRGTLVEERQRFVDEVNAHTTDDIVASMQTMSDYAIFRRLQGNLSRLENARNIDSVLIQVTAKNASSRDCYRVLGDIHMKYPVRSGSFYDFISAPQPNGYQGLHTTIFLGNGRQLRLQIQTEVMFEFMHRRKISGWIEDRSNAIYQSLSALHLTSPDSEEFMADLDGTVLKNRINVFTTSGEIVALPQGSNGIDFTYAMSPDHISYLSAILVNGERKVVTTKLNDGDTVESVLLASNTDDKRAMWVNTVKSIEAREGIKESLGEADLSERHTQGKSLLEAELRKQRLPVWALTQLTTLQNDLVQRIDIGSFNEVLEQLGTGTLPVSTVVDAYRAILIRPLAWPVKILKWFYLLPRERVLNEHATIFEIEIQAEDRQGLIHDITQCFADRDINIARFGVFALPPRDALYRIRLEAENFDVFSDLYDALLEVPNVRKITRK